MTDNPENSEAEAERIRKWREERAAVAEKEKQERIRKAKIAREESERRESEQRRTEAEKLLPTNDEIERSRQRVVAYAAKKKKRLILQVLIWVCLPTMLVVFYATQIATPLYESRSIMVVSKAAGDPNEGLGGVLGAAVSPSNLHETFMAHEYIKSQALMEQIEKDTGLVSELSSTRIDPVQRLRNIRFLRLDKHSQFGLFVNSSVDVQTGLMTLYVRMPDAMQAKTVSEDVLDYVANHINALSEALFQERILQATKTAQDSRANLVKKQADLTQLQIESGELNPQASIEGVFRTVTELEVELQNLRSEIEMAKVSGQSETFQTQRLLEFEKSLSDRIKNQRGLLVEGSSDGRPALNSILLKHELAMLQVRIAEEALTMAIASLVEAREKAALGRSLFQVVVPPSIEVNPTSPNVLVSALIALITSLAIFVSVKLLN